MNNNSQGFEQQKELKELVPLKCRQCGGLVPLVAQQVIGCPYCSADVEIPLEYRNNYAARKKLSTRLEQAEEFFHSLGRKPGYFEVFIAKISATHIGIAFVFMVIFYSLLLRLIMISFDRFSKMAHEMELAALMENSIIWSVSIIGGPLFLMAAFSGFMLYIRGKVLARQQLLCTIAAVEPTVEGGPAICRHCGGGIAVEEGDLSAECGYCGTDNYLQIPQSWLQETRNRSSSVGSDLVWAASEYERYKLFAFRSSVGQGSLVIPLILLLTVNVQVLGSKTSMFGWPPPYRHAVRADLRPIERRLLSKDWKYAKDGLLPVVFDHDEIPVPAPMLEKSFEIAGHYFKTGNDYHFPYIFPMRRGDALKVYISGIFDTEVFWRRFQREYNDPDWRINSERHLKPYVPATFTAGHDGWYRIDIVLTPMSSDEKLYIEFIPAGSGHEQ